MAQGFGDYASQPQPPKKSNKVLYIILGIVGVVAVLAGLCCCVGPGALFFFGKGVLNEAMANELRGNATFREHLGDLQSCNMSLVATGEVGEEGVVAFDVVGSKGSGLVIARMQEGSGTQVVQSATLRLSSGEEIELMP
jgi:hypothetical protein